MNVNKLFMAGAGVAAGIAIYAVAIKGIERFAPDAANFFKDAFSRI